MKAEDAPGTEAPGPGPPPRLLLEELLRAAIAAPSLYNTQPWRFRIRDAGNTVELWLDPERLLPIADADSRAAHIGCGAALLNLRVAAAAAGLQPIVRLIPDPAEPFHLARIELTGTCEATPSEVELSGAIPQRHTNRQPFSNRAVPPGVRAEFAQAAEAEGAMLQFPGRDEASRLCGLAAEAERGLLAAPGYRGELTRWVGGDRLQDGIPTSALGPRSPEGREPVRGFITARAGETAPYAWFEEHPLFAVLSVRSGGPRGWLAAGQALERAWLTATCRGVSFCPLTQPLETADAWLVRDPRSGTGYPQMILRIGYGLPTPAAAVRRPVADVVDEWIPASDDQA